MKRPRHLLNHSSRVSVRCEMKMRLQNTGMILSTLATKLTNIHLAIIVIIIFLSTYPFLCLCLSLCLSACLSLSISTTINHSKPPPPLLLCACACFDRGAAATHLPVLFSLSLFPLAPSSLEAHATSPPTCFLPRPERLLDSWTRRASPVPLANPEPYAHPLSQW